MRVSRTVIGLLGALLAATPSSCDRSLPPEGQIVLYLDSDAPLAPLAAMPASSSEAPLLVPVPLFDRVLIELFEPLAALPCPDCRRELVVDAALMKSKRFSFGFVPRPRVVGYRARLVLYRSVAGIAPRANASIELVGYLPAVMEDGIKEMTARFRVEDVGKPRGTLSAPIIFDVGAPSESAVGSWSGARVTACERDTPTATTTTTATSSLCVLGGAFWMGDPRVTLEGSTVGGAKEHIAIVPPFFLDRTEVTVAEFRTSKLAKLDSRGRSSDPMDDLSDSIAGQCDYSSARGANEALPVTCVSWELARSYCKAKGGDLPSEAELEIATSLRGTSLTPWGDRDPTCEEASTAKKLLKKAGGCSDANEFDTDHRVLPLPSGSGTRDRVALVDGAGMRTGELLDLGANLAEWTRDAFQPDDGPCWSASLIDAPSCAVDPANKNKDRSVKGGDLIDLPVRFAQTRRAFDGTFASYAQVGFRCSYPGR